MKNEGKTKQQAQNSAGRILRRFTKERMCIFLLLLIYSFLCVDPLCSFGILVFPCVPRRGLVYNRYLVHVSWLVDTELPHLAPGTLAPCHCDRPSMPTTPAFSFFSVARYFSPHSAFAHATPCLVESFHFQLHWPNSGSFPNPSPHPTPQILD